jgi:hypothetical protein
MHTLNGTILPEGAFLEVLIGLAGADAQKLRKSGAPVPAALAARALLDTGAGRGHCQLSGVSETREVLAGHSGLKRTCSSPT